MDDVHDPSYGDDLGCDDLGYPEGDPGDGDHYREPLPRPDTVLWSPLLSDRPGAASFPPDRQNDAYHQVSAALPDLRCGPCAATEHHRCNGFRADPRRGVQRCLCWHRRNTHCSHCGDTRGGPLGHEASECQWQPDPDPRPFLG